MCCGLGLPGIAMFWDSWLFRSDWMLLRLGITSVQRGTAVTARFFCAQIKPRGVRAPKPRGVVGCGIRRMQIPSAASLALECPSLPSPTPLLADAP